eukprot:m.432927 g.432927  ORF g.432927 m.432927 type:complete len:145 (-) comp17505_c0_seq1:76-510(-)
MKWVSEQVPYCQCPGDPPDCCGTCKYCNQGYPGNPWRCDCSGFVSWAWGLPGGQVTSTLGQVSYQIEGKHLKKGDVMLNPAVDGHVMLFDGWANDAQTAFYAIQEPGCHAAGLPPHATRNVQTWPVWGQKDLFKPFRYLHIRDD